MICILYDYLQNFNNFEQKVAELQNFKFGQELWNALYVPIV